MQPSQQPRPRGKSTVAPLRRFQVELPHVEPLVVDDCQSPAEAFAKYKQARGIVDSDHAPRIVEIDR